MKTIPFFCLLFLLTLSSMAQPSATSTQWYPGIVILQDEQVLRGDISYDFAHDLVMCRQEGTIRTFGPQQAQSFRYYEEEANLLHNFSVYTLQKNSFYEQKGFFEIVLQGDVSYVRKRNKYPIYQTRNGYMQPRDFRNEPHLVAYDYYILVNDEMIKARNFKKEVLPALLQEDRSIKAFMKEKRLRTYDIADQIVLLDYYNKAPRRNSSAALGTSAQHQLKDMN
ncbi:MAG: hypothetical protein ACLFUB_21030 [Cyclobacteriaceae bacterium]